jgi:hypothetical protein
MVFPSTKGRNLEKGEQLASFTQSPGNQMQKIEAEVSLTAQIFDHFSHYCFDL